MEVFLKTEDEMYSLLTQIRVVYTSKRKEKGFAFASLSLKGTIADTVSEVRIKYCLCMCICTSCIYGRACCWVMVG